LIYLALTQRKLLATDYVHLDRQELHETGEYDSEGLFVRLNAAVSRVGAKRVVLDSIDTLFAGIPNEAILRSELRRLFVWLKDARISTSLLWAAFIGFGIQFFSNRAAHLDAMTSQTAS
jgi:circadian clock protein KaiC